MERSVSEIKKMRKRDAVLIFHLIKPLITAITALPDAQTASNKPDCALCPWLWEKPTTTIAIAPKKPPVKVVAKAMARTIGKPMTGGYGSLVRTGDGGGSVAFCIAKSGMPMAKKIIPAINPAAGAIEVAQAVAVIGPMINTTSSISAS